MDKRATPSQIESFLAHYPYWVLEEGRLHRVFKFEDFAEAFAFMTRVALVAERQKHHPEWCNSYSQVAVNLTTHEAGGITERDFQLARIMDRFAV